MICFTTEQIDAMTRGMEAELHERIAAFAREALAPFVSSLDDEALRARVVADHQAAKALGVTTMRGVMDFVTLSLISGVAWFWHAEPVKRALDTGIDPELLFEKVLLSLPAILEKLGEG